MILGIKPGILIQEHKPELVLERLKLLKKHATNIETIMIDGGVNFQTIREYILYGANHLVCGSSTIYKNTSFDDDVSKVASIKHNLKILKEIMK